MDGAKMTAQCRRLHTQLAPWILFYFIFLFIWSTFKTRRARAKPVVGLPMAPLSLVILPSSREVSFLLSSKMLDAVISGQLMGTIFFFFRGGGGTITNETKIPERTNQRRKERGDYKMMRRKQQQHVECTAARYFTPVSCAYNGRRTYIACDLNSRIIQPCAALPIYREPCAIMGALLFTSATATALQKKTWHAGKGGTCV